MDGNELMSRFEELLNSRGLEVSDPSMIGDLADLYLTVQSLQSALDRVLDPPTDASNSQSKSDFLAFLAKLWDRVDYMEMICKDLRSPLERLIEGEGRLDALIHSATEEVESTTYAFSLEPPDDDEKPN